MASKQGIDIDLIRGEQSRRSLIEFVKFFWPVVEPSTPYIHGWHIDAICEHLTALSKREIRNLLVNIPPRCCKSTLFNVMFPAWQWLHQPGEKYLFTSFKMDLAERDSVKCRRLIKSDLFQKVYPKAFQLVGDQDTKRRFDNTMGGSRLIGSIGGTSSTGEGGSIIIVDDPHSAQEVESDVRRANVIRWFTEVFFNRLNNQMTGCRAVVGQRIHNEDLSGHLLENYKDFWVHLNLPYEFSETRNKSTAIGWSDPRTIEGQPLWPEAFPESEIETHKKKPQYFQSQYNQCPINLETALFKPDYFKHYMETPDAYKNGEKVVNKSDCFYTLITADLAISESKKADYTAIVVATIARSGEIIVLDIVRERMNGTKIIPKLIEMNEEYQPAYIMIEDVAFQKVIIDQARQEGLPVRQLKAVGDKEVRSLTLQTRAANGQLWFPNDKPWVKVAEKELLEFPQSAHDDIVDALSYMAKEAALKTRTRPTIKPEDITPQKTLEQIYQDAILQGIR